MPVIFLCIFICIESPYTACGVKPKFQISDIQNVCKDVSCFIILLLSFLLNNCSINVIYLYNICRIYTKMCLHIKIK